ncbi:MAG: hypothetical protein RLZZ223_244 [Candidatus Parcubacteria bacterium]|jgi:hypothetical protein
MKNWLNKNLKLVFTLSIIVLLAIGSLYVYFILLDKPKVKVTDFESCKEARGGAITKSYPAQCTYDGVTYTENVANEEQSPNQEGLNLDLPESEKAQIEAWLEKNSYNQYGDKPDTVYMGGTPLFDESKGTYIKLYDYLVQKYPDKPWLEKVSDSNNITENSNTNPAVKSFAEVKVWQNFEDPNFELQYPDFVSMANQNGYPVKFSNNDGFEFIIDVTDKSPNYAAGSCDKKLSVSEQSVYLCYNKTITYQEIYQRMLDSFVIR